MSDPLTLIHGDALSSLRELDSESVQTCVTSPPYFGLRSYGTEPIVWGGDPECEHEWVKTKQYQDSPIRSGGEGVGFDDAETTKAQRWRTHGFCKCGAWRGELGLEPTPEMYVQHLVEIFREVNRVLRKDGTCWVNLGDSYASGKGSCFNPGGAATSLEGHAKLKDEAAYKLNRSNKSDLEKIGLKPKDLYGIPWRFAFAMQSDGWYLRSDIIWSKPNPMPESVTDRPTRSHEYIFLLSKSRPYFYDAEAISEPSIHAGESRTTTAKSFAGQAEVPGRIQSGNAVVGSVVNIKERRNKRSVWTVGTQSFADAHFATFPTDLVEPCILAGSPAGGTVLDPFSGSGTTAKVAIELGRKAIAIEPKAEYVEMIKRRCQTTIGLPLE